MTHWRLRPSSPPGLSCHAAAGPGAGVASEAVRGRTLASWACVGQAQELRMLLPPALTAGDSEVALPSAVARGPSLTQALCAVGQLTTPSTGRGAGRSQQRALGRKEGRLPQKAGEGKGRCHRTARGTW